MVKRVISSMMYCNAERDRREKVRDINREEKWQNRGQHQYGEKQEEWYLRKIEVITGRQLVPALV